MWKEGREDRLRECESQKEDSYTPSGRTVERGLPVWIFKNYRRAREEGAAGCLGCLHQDRASRREDIGPKPWSDLPLLRKARGSHFVTWPILGPGLRLGMGSEWLEGILVARFWASGLELAAWRPVWGSPKGKTPGWSRT